MINCIINEMIAYFKNDVKRINHALKVHEFASLISSTVNISQKERTIIGFAAILHDIGIKEAERRYGSTAGVYQEIEGPPIAKQILESYRIESDIIFRVCYLIENHHSYLKINGIDFQILIEADFLVNIYEDNINRASVEMIKQKYFKTEYGIRLLESMYLQ